MIKKPYKEVQRKAAIGIVLLTILSAACVALASVAYSAKLLSPDEGTLQVAKTASPGDNDRVRPQILHRERHLLFTDIGNGTLEVKNAGTSVVIAKLPSGTGSFVRGTLRALNRERRSLDRTQQLSPFKLRQSERGLVLEDPATGTSLHLNAYGQSNVAQFRRFLEIDTQHASREG